MKTVLKLDEASQRPLIHTNQFPGCMALLDTGATFPMWTDSEEALKALGGKLVKDNVFFSGFGGLVSAKIYELTVQLGDLIYPHMHLLFSQDDAIPGHLLLSATMFCNMYYAIDDKAHTLEIDTRSHQLTYHLKIEDKNGRLHVLCATGE